MPQTIKQEIVAKSEEIHRLADAHPTLHGKDRVTAGPKDFEKNWDKGWNKDGH